MKIANSAKWQNYFTHKVYRLDVAKRLKSKVSPCTQGEKGSGVEGRAAVRSVHAGMMRPLELEALIAQKRACASKRTRATSGGARPSPPGPLSPLSTKGRGGAR